MKNSMDFSTIVLMEPKQIYSVVASTNEVQNEMNSDPKIVCILMATVATVLPAACAEPSAGDKTAPTQLTADKADWAKKGTTADTKPVGAQEKKANEDTARAVNTVPGVSIKPQALVPPAEDQPIHGFHPIKKLLQPIVKLEKNSTELEQQIMKLEGPIAGLQKPMLGLQKKMSNVEMKMGGMQSHLDNVDAQMAKVGGKVGGVGTQIGDVGRQLGDVESQMRTVAIQMTGIRTDLSGMHKQIGQLQVPIEKLQSPLTGISRPLKSLDQKLDRLVALLATILGAIIVAAIAIAIGTPVTAILIYKHRRKLFPHMSDQDFPVAKPLSKVA